MDLPVETWGSCPPMTNALLMNLFPPAGRPLMNRWCDLVWIAAPFVRPPSFRCIAMWQPLLGICIEKQKGVPSFPPGTLIWLHLHLAPLEQWGVLVNPKARGKPRVLTSIDVSNKRSNKAAPTLGKTRARASETSALCPCSQNSVPPPYAQRIHARKHGPTAPPIACINTTL